MGQITAYDRILFHIVVVKSDRLSSYLEVHMRQDITLEEYTNYRKQYIDEAKRACYAQEPFGKAEEPIEETPAISFEKVRLLLAMLLFIGFLYCRYTDTDINGYGTDDIITMVEEQRFPVASSWMERFAQYLSDLK